MNHLCSLGAQSDDETRYDARTRSQTLAHQQNHPPLPSLDDPYTLVDLSELPVADIQEPSAHRAPTHIREFTVTRTGAYIRGTSEASTELSFLDLDPDEQAQLSQSDNQRRRYHKGFNFGGRPFHPEPYPATAPHSQKDEPGPLHADNVEDIKKWYDMDLENEPSFLQPFELRRYQTRPDYIAGVEGREFHSKFT